MNHKDRSMSALIFRRSAARHSVRPSVLPSAAALAVLAFTALGSAHAQSVTPTYTFTPQFSVTDPDSDWGIAKNPRGGSVKLGKTFSPTTELQLSLGSDRKSIDGTTYRQTLLGVEGLYKLNPGGAWRPFVSVGLGAERDRLSNAALSATRTSPYASAGLGLQYWINNSVGLQVDAKRVHGFLGDDGRASFGQGSSMNNVYSAGLVFAFGAPREAARPVIVPVVETAPPPPAPTVVEVPVPVPVPPPPPPAPKFERVTLSATELFAFNSAVLSTPQPKLDELATLLNTDTSIGNVTIEGHTDRLGPAAANKKLSQQRAEAVRDYLAAKGVAASRLEAVGLGSSKPVKTCDDKAFRKDRAGLIECLAPNRRVEVLPVTGKRPLN